MRKNKRNSKRILLFIAKLTLVVVCITIQGFRYSDSHSLIVKITNLENSRGVVEIGLYEKGDDFPTPGMQYRKARVKIDGTTATYEFKNLANGDYAIATYHDENGDNQCNKNMFGVPTEAYAFSNNVRPFLSAPKFNSCRFWVTETRGLAIKMVY